MPPTALVRSHRDPLHVARPQRPAAVQQPPLVGDFVFLLGQIVDQLLEVVVGQVAEVGQRFQRAAFRVVGSRSKAAGG